MSDVRALVDKGVAKLNEHFVSPNWLRRVSTLTLNLADDGQCVLGQLFGDYETGVIALCGDVDPHQFGYLSGPRATNRELTDEWISRVKRLRNPKVGDDVLVTYRATWQPDMALKSHTHSPLTLRSALVLNTRPAPEPGDRVHQPSTSRFGSVLKPSPHNPFGGNGSVRVAWDGAGLISQVDDRELTVMTS